MAYTEDNAALAEHHEPRDHRSTWHSRLFGIWHHALVGILALAFSSTVFGFVIYDAFNAVYKDTSGLKRITAQRWNERTLAFPIEGVDRAGRTAEFDVVVLTKDYGWVHGSTTELERGDRRLTQDDIERYVLAPQLREGLGRARGIIAVGLASQEGEIEREAQRAGLRANRIAEWVKGVVNDETPMWTLNLGRYLDVCAECEDADTSWQRPFIVIAIRRTDAYTNIAEALNSALSNKENLPSPSRYSSFALAQYRR